MKFGISYCKNQISRILYCETRIWVLDNLATSTPTNGTIRLPQNGETWLNLLHQNQPPTPQPIKTPKLFSTFMINNSNNSLSLPLNFRPQHTSPLPSSFSSSSSFLHPCFFTPPPCFHPKTCFLTSLSFNLR